MKGNATAGILLMLLAAVAIGIGVSPNGKAIIALIFNKQAATNTTPKTMPGYEAPGSTDLHKDTPSGAPTANSPLYGFAGERGAVVA